MRYILLTMGLLLGNLVWVSAQHTSDHTHHATGDTPAACCEKPAAAAACCAKPATSSAQAAHPTPHSTVPAVALLDQHGQTVDVHELMGDKLVVMNFIFTTCTTICPPMGANFVNLQQRLQDHIGSDIVMLTVSIDPVTDTPERLKAWSEKFKPGPGWTLLTGDKATVDHLLKSLKVYTPLIDDHAPVLMVGKLGESDWLRTNGLAAPDQLAGMVRERLAQSAPVAAAAGPSPEDIENSSRSYFTDTELINQHGETLRFYTDLLHEKTVIINPFFADCTGSCPAMHTALQQVQEHLGDRLGKDVHIVSITVDSENDSPEKLAGYAQRFSAGQGWHFLSGSPENVDLILSKLGKSVEFREQHDAIFLVGNLRTLLWKKVNGLAPPAEIIPLIDDVINDEG